jgi:GxxExxY protein
MSDFKKEGISTETNKISEMIVDSALAVHKKMGPGLLEGIYESCLVKEFQKRNIRFERQKQVPVFYGDEPLDEKLRLDLMVEDKVVVEIKAVDELMPIHEVRVLTYLKLTGCEVGLLINFNVKLIKNGIQRVALARS